MFIRVVVEYSPLYFAFLGLMDETQCLPSLDLDGQTFYRSRSTPRWVLYRPAVRVLQGGSGPMQNNQ